MKNLDLPKGWRRSELNAFCKFEKGTSITKNEVTDGKIPVIGGGKGPAYYHNLANRNKNVITVSSSGANSGFVNYFERPIFASDCFTIENSTNDILLKYVYYYLKNKQNVIYSLQKGCGQPHVYSKDVGKLMISVPPLETQQKIVSYLDKAVEIKRLRAEANTQIQKLIQSIYIRLFYKYNSDYYKWPSVNIKDLADQSTGSMRSGPFGSDLKHSEFVDNGFAVLGIDNVVDNSFQWGERRYIKSEKFESLKRYRVYPNDVLITIMGTIGRSCVVPLEIPLSISTKHLAVITCNHEICIPQFLSSSIIFHPEIKRQLMANSKGAIMDGLNLGIIKSVDLHLPPLDLQHRFCTIALKIQEYHSISKEANIDLELLFSAITQKAITGELVA